MDAGTIILIVSIGTVANLAYQGANFYIYYNEHEGKFPWSDMPIETGKRMFAFAVCLKLFIAALMVLLLGLSNQVTGVIGAAMIGMAGEEIMMAIATLGRRLASNVQA